MKISHISRWRLVAITVLLFSCAVIFAIMLFTWKIRVELNECTSNLQILYYAIVLYQADSHRQRSPENLQKLYSFYRTNPRRLADLHDWLQHKNNTNKTSFPLRCPTSRYKDYEIKIFTAISFADSYILSCPGSHNGLQLSYPKCVTISLQDLSIIRHPDEIDEIEILHEVNRLRLKEIITTEDPGM